MVIPRRNSTMDQQRSLRLCRHKTLVLLSLLCAPSFVKAFTISTLPPTTLLHQQRNHRLLTASRPPLRSSSSSSNDNGSTTSTTAVEDATAAAASTTAPSSPAVVTRQARIRQRVGELAKRIVLAPIRTASNISPMPKAVAAVLKDATLNTLDLAVDEGA